MTTSVNDLLKQEPESLTEWLEKEKARVEDTTDTKEPNWWLGIAQVASSKAQKEFSTNQDKAGWVRGRLDWAQVAIWVYDYLANRLNPEGRNAYECSAKMLSVALIGQFGPVENHSILDHNLIEDWFFQRLTMSSKEAASLAANWQTRPIEEIRQLRALKLRLNVIEQLKLKGYLQSNTELSRWLELKDRLP